MTVQGEGKFEITQSKYRLSEDQKQDDGQKLFDFCAECLKTFIDTNLAQEEGGFQLKEGETLPLGFTVSCIVITSVRNANYENSSHTLASKLGLLSINGIPANSSPNRQNKIDHGVLIRWTKGFGAPNTEGRDVAEMFRKSLEKYVRPFPRPCFPLMSKIIMSIAYGTFLASPCDTHCPHQ